MAAVTTFSRQTELIMEAAVEAVIAECLQRLGQQGTDGSDTRIQLTAVLHVMSREAIRKICRVFRELYMSLEKETEALKEEVKHLESQMKNQNNSAAKKNQTQTLYKIKPAGGPSTSLDISQPAANPAALAMAILSSAKPTHKSSSSPQVPLVIISQPLPGPAAEQSSTCPQMLQEKPDHRPPDLGLADIEVLESIQTSTDTDGSPDSIQLLPVVDNQPTSELTGVSVTVSEDPLTHEEEPSVNESGMKMETVKEKGKESQPGLNEEEQKEVERKRRRRELYKRRGFHQKHQLSKHLSCHLKPFPCSSCDKGFYKAKTLQKHQLSHQLREAQENDPNKLLSCNQCDRKFRLLRQLRVHQASHRLEKMPL
ncbi:hypothetical protein INR49_018561, partial [Caranx melampygus]